MLARLLKIFIAFPKATFFSTLLVCVILSLFAPKLEIDASAESLLLEDDKDLKVFRELSKHYKSDDFLMLAFKPKNLNPFSKESLEKLENLHKDLEKIEGVSRILSIINAPLFQSSQNLELKELLKNIPSITSEGVDLNKAKEEILNSPFYKSNIISKDAQFTALLIYLKPDLIYSELVEKRDLASKEGQKQEYRLKIKKHQDAQRLVVKERLQKIKNLVKSYESKGDKLYLGGVSMIADDMISYIKADLVLYGLSLVFLLGFALWYFFRTLIFVFLPLFICFITLSSASGLFALLNFNITVISSNYVALVLIITLSVVIHIISHFIENSLKYKNSPQNRLILKTLLEKAKPSFYAIVTTMIGFCSLVLSNIEPIINLGIMMSVGIAFSLVLSYLFLASLLMLLKPKIYEKSKIRFNFLALCANISLKYRSFVYIVALFAVVLAFWGISALRVENSFVNYFKDGSEIKKGLLVIDKNLGGTLPLDIVVKFKKERPETSGNLDDFEEEFEKLASEDTYFFNAHKTRIAKKIHEYLENKAYIGSVLSLNSLLVLGKKINENKDLDDFALAFLNENLPQNFKQDLLSNYVNIENNELRFSMRIIDSDPSLRRNEFLAQLQNELETLLKNDALEFQITGLMLLYNNMLQALFASQFNTLAFVILAIFVLFVVIFRNLKFSILAILVNVIPLSLVFAFMGILGIPLDMMSITIAAIAIGIGVDDAIHYIYRFKEELKTKSVKEAVKASHLSIGSALYYTTISVVLGFAVMMSSNFIPTIYFGFLTVFVMLLLLSGSLILLPSLLISFIKK